MLPIGCEASGYIACPILTPDRAFRLAREPRMLAAVSGLDFRLYGLANNLRTVSRQLRCPPHARQCLLNVDSSRRVRANSGHYPTAWRMRQIMGTFETRNSSVSRLPLTPPRPQAPAHESRRS